MFFPFLRRDKLFDTVRKKDDSDLIVVLYRRKSQRRGDFGNHLFLQFTYGTEITAGRHIDQQHDRHLPFLFKNFDIRTLLTSGYIPVNIPHIIAKLVFSYLRKCHTFSFKGRMVLPGKYVSGESTCLYLDAADLFQQLGCIHNTYSPLREI